MTTSPASLRSLTTDQLIQNLATRRFQLTGSRSLLGNVYNKIAGEARTIAAILEERGLATDTINAIR